MYTSSDERKRTGNCQYSTVTHFDSIYPLGCERERERYIERERDPF